MYAGVPKMVPGCVIGPDRRIRRRQPGEAEIENLHAAVARHHHVVRLEVAVHDAVLVRVRQRGGQLAGDARQVRRRRAPAAIELIPQRRAVDELRGDEQVAVELLEGVDRADARMREAGRRARLAAQSIAVRRYRTSAPAAAP